MNFRIWIPTLFFFLSICQNIFAAQVSGSIESDTIWEEEITVTGDVIIEISAKLTIRPGTVIRFNGDYSLTVNGLLIAEGVEGNLIQFISGNETPSAGDWSGVRLKGWQWEQNRLKHVEIRHAASGVVVSGTDVQARLSHVLVDQVSERGLSVLSGSSVVVENSTIRDFGDTGIRAHGGGSGLTLVGSTITQQNPNRIRTGRGVSVEDGAEVVLDGNQISFTDVGVYAHSNRRAPDVTALGNVITENRKGIQINAWSNGTRSYANVHVRENDIFDNREWNVEILAGSNPTNTLLDFTDNWWGTTDGVAIAGAIYDASNRDDRAFVNYLPFLDENGQSGRGNYLSGWVARDSTLQAGAHVVSGKLVARDGYSLVAGPGVELRFAERGQIEAFGKLDLAGDENNKVVARSDRATPSPGNWSGIHIRTGHVQEHNLEHVEIRHAASGVVVSGTDVQARLSHVLVDQVSERGLSVLSGSSVVVENSTIRDFGDTGIRAHGGGSGLTLVGSTITQQNPNRIRTGRGVSVEDGAEVVLDGNQISFTDVGVYAHSNRRAPDVTALGNVITENRKGIQINAWSNGTRSYANVHVRENDIFDNREWNVEILAGSNPTNTLLDFTDNWWGTTDGVAIAGAIYDASNRDDQAEVNFNPFLSETSGIYGRADINRDGRTDGFDLAVLASSFGLSEEAEGFNGKADIYRDGRIDGFDLAILGIHFGQTGSDTTPQKVLPSQEMEPIEITVKDEYVEHSRADTVIYSVHLENVSSLFAIAVDLKYDKTLTFIEGEESNFINIEEQKSTVFLEDHDEKSNILSLGITRLNNASERFADGDGTVFRIKFLASESNSTLSDPILKRIGLFAPNGRQYKYNYNTDDDRSLTESLDIPENFELRQNYPNPFNPSTVIAYSLPVQSEVKLEVFDLIGRRVALLVDQVKQAGDHRVNFEAQNLSSGVYLYRISASGYTDLRKMSLIK